jgi:hypothetical protein
MSSISTDFRLRLDKPVFEDNPELKILPEFARLTDRQMKYVMLVDWYRSPLRMMKIEDRKLKAALLAGYKLEKGGDRPDVNTRNVVDGKVGTIEAARKVMKEIQFDFDQDLLDTINFQIEEIKGFLKQPDKTTQQLDKAIQFVQKLPALYETRVKLKAILGMREDVPVEEIIPESGTFQERTLLDDYNDQEI